MDFIKKHLIKNIKDQIIKKQKNLGFYEFFWFDYPVMDGCKIINRCNTRPYYTDEILSCDWALISNKALLDIFLILKNNSFFIYDRRDSNMRIRLPQSKIVINDF
jgi:hypothetical protein